MRTGLIAGMLSLAVVSTTPVQAQTSSARVHYARAIEHLSKGELREARAAFAEAYQASPHYAVLYNLGRVSLELRDFAAARDYLERYLSEGADSLTPQQRAQAEQLLTEAKDGDASTSDAAVASPPAADDAAPRETLKTTTPAAGPRRAVSRTAPPPAGAAPSDGQAFLGVALGSAGAALVLAGATVLVWNETRYQDYDIERERVAGELAGGAAETRDPAAYADLVRAAARSNAELDAIRRVDTVGWTTLGVGGALLATGIGLYVLRPERATLALGAGRIDCSVRF